MLSAQRLAANRLNAQKSTGPRTSAGKAKVAQNARRHGLATPIQLDLQFNPRTPRLAALLADGGDAAAATPLAYALVELQRLRETRADILREVAAESPSSAAATPLDHTAVYLAALPRLHRLERYERAIWAKLARELAIYEARPRVSTETAAKQSQAPEQSHCDAG